MQDVYACSGYKNANNQIAKIINKVLLDVRG